MNLTEKLLNIQTRVDGVVKDAQNTSDKYRYTSSTLVNSTIRPLMNEHRLLLIPETTNAKLTEGATRSGTTRYMTELYLNMVWLDVDTGDKLSVPWYAQGVDLAGEKGVGKAQTYAEKYFLLKFFHVPTDEDDPDNSTRNKNGELRTRNTAAQRETGQYCRAAIRQMLLELYADDEDKRKEAMLSLTRNESRQYPGVDDPEKLSDMKSQEVYGKLKPRYEKRMGKAFVFSGVGEVTP